MADRVCSLCREPYTDETGHDYDCCVKQCVLNLDNAHDGLQKAADAYVDAKRHLAEAKVIQAQTWWRKQ